MNSKLLPKLGVVMVLVGFPLISWVYLSMGIDFRKEMLNKLDVKFESQAFNIQIDSSKSISNELFIDNTSLVFFLNTQNDEISQLISTCLDQLKAREDFQVLILHNQTGICNYPNANVACNHLETEILDNIKYTNFGVPNYMPNNVAALVDTAQMIRYFYNLDSNKINEIYEDLVFVLPPEAENNVAIKR